MTNTFSVIFVWLWQLMTIHFAISVKNLTCLIFAANFFCEFFHWGPRNSSRYFLRQLDLFILFDLLFPFFFQRQLKSCSSTCLCNLMFKKTKIHLRLSSMQVKLFSFEYTYEKFWTHFRTSSVVFWIEMYTVPRQKVPDFLYNTKAYSAS